MKVLEWVVGIIRRWLDATSTGRVEIHFADGKIQRVVEIKTAFPPQ